MGSLRSNGVSFTVLVAVGGIAVASSAPSHGIACSLIQVRDSQRSGLVAFTYLAPKGWKAKNSMTWNGNVYEADYGAETADEQYSVSRFEPFTMTYWSTNGRVTGGARLAHATDFLKIVASNLQKSGLIDDFKVLDQSDTSLPPSDIQKMTEQQPTYGSGRLQFREAGFLKLAFTKNGFHGCAGLGATVEGTLLSLNASYGRGIPTYSQESGAYIIGPTLIIATPESPDPQRVKEVQIVASSARITPDFRSYTIALALKISEANLEANRERIQQENRMMEERREKSMAEFRHQMEVKDDNSRQFCNYIRDQQDYVQPDGARVTLPMQYDHSWVNSAGEYILNSDPTFDPKGYGSGGWVQLQKYVPKG
ncbi:MAG TPA: hypothetical protein VG944_06960 [Fimbriimonas sp.]|nr:hypothetical protein [Fimbriimonas sp.]